MAVGKPAGCKRLAYPRPGHQRSLHEQPFHLNLADEENLFQHFSTQNIQQLSFGHPDAPWSHTLPKIIE